MSKSQHASTKRFEAPAFVSRTSPMLPLNWFVYQKGTLRYQNNQLSFVNEKGDVIFETNKDKAKVEKETLWVSMFRLKVKIKGGKKWWIGFYPNMVSENFLISPYNVAKIDTFVELVHSGKSRRLANRTDMVYEQPPRGLIIFGYVFAWFMIVLVLGLALVVAVPIILAVLRGVMK